MRTNSAAAAPLHRDPPLDPPPGAYPPPAPADSVKRVVSYSLAFLLKRGRVTYSLNAILTIYRTGKRLPCAAYRCLGYRPPESLPVKPREERSIREIKPVSKPMRAGMVAARIPGEEGPKLKTVMPGVIPEGPVEKAAGISITLTQHPDPDET